MSASADPKGTYYVSEKTNFICIIDEKTIEVIFKMKKIIAAAMCAVITAAVPCAQASAAVQYENAAFVESGRAYGNFEYDTLTSGTVEIKRYNGSEEHVDIPREINGMKVTYIGWNAFKTSPTLKSVSIPDSVTAIGKWAFFSCKKLESAPLPDSVSSISAYAFAGCDALGEVELPASVHSVGESAFAGCAGLEKAVIPESVVSISDRAFYNCPKLTIYCCPGTAGESYAKREDIPYLLMSAGICGDVDGDGRINSSDALSVLRASVDLETLSELSRLRADVNSDGAADSSDALEILRSSVGLGGNAKIGKNL